MSSAKHDTSAVVPVGYMWPNYAREEYPLGVRTGIGIVYSLTSSRRVGNPFFNPTHSLNDRIDDAKTMDTVDHAHFAGIPWCALHLQGDRIITRTPLCRTLKPANEDSLFGDTLSSERGIVRMLQVYEGPSSQTGRIEGLKVFLTLASGLNGHANVCHGGLVMTILDEALSLLVGINQEHGGISGKTFLTAYLNTSFVKPVWTPTTILARTCLTKVEGRKCFARGTMEDEHGAILARADSLFILVKSFL
ncbi:HotDog domain-containing protein [Xylaria palmicola]|nr:HotDog domain-containing protein [Xylaria palmicola]